MKQTSLRNFFGGPKAAPSSPAAAKAAEPVEAAEKATKKRPRPEADNPADDSEATTPEAGGKAVSRKSKLLLVDSDGEDETMSPPPAKRPKTADSPASPSTEPAPAPKSITPPAFAKQQPPRERLGKEFYEQDCIALSKALLGQFLVRILPDGTRLVGKIVEVEAYLGGEDKAAHSYKGIRTEKNKSMFMDPGTSYVYTIYVHNICFNISSLGEGAAALVRALEPVQGTLAMEKARRSGQAKRSGGQKPGAPKPLKATEIGSGPGKLCQAMQITMDFDGIDLITDESLFLEKGKPVLEDQIVADRRVGVEHAGSVWGYQKELRFSIKHNPHVSVKPGARKDDF